MECCLKNLDLEVPTFAKQSFRDSRDALMCYLKSVPHKVKEQILNSH